MVKLLVIRHGKTDWNLNNKIQGRTDIALSQLGREELVGRRVPDEFSGNHPGEQMPLRALIEMSWGEWEGETLKALHEKYGAEFRYNEARGLQMTPPGGESPADVVERLQPWLKSLASDTIAVTHKGVIRAIKSLAYNWDMTDKAPVSFDWATGHLFEVSASGDSRPLRINISMEDA